MDDREIVIADVDGKRAYTDFFAKTDNDRDCLASGVVTIVDAATTLSIEAAWPTLLEVARKAEEGDIALSSGWKIRSVVVPSGPHSSFVMEHEDMPGGFLFDIPLRTELTDEASAAIDVILREKAAVIEAIPDAEVREAARKAMLAKTSEDVIAVKQDPKSYRDHGDCRNAASVACYAYRADGLFPPGYNGSGSELDETLALIGQNAYSLGLLFKSRTSVHLQFGTLPPYLIFDPSGYVRDPAMTLTAFEILFEAIDEMQMLDGISDRVELVKQLKYSYSSPNPSFGLLLEMGFDTVTASGLPGENALATAVHFWTAAIAIDVTRAAKDIEAMAGKLEMLGHVTSDNPFCFRMFDEAFVAGSGNDEYKTLWIGSGSIPFGFRIDFTPSEDSDIPTRIKAAMVTAEKRPGVAPDPDIRGFLFDFEVQDEEGYWPLDVGEFDGRTIDGAYRLCGLLGELKVHLGKA